jgi:Tfp pilus assembly protein PilE
MRKGITLIEIAIVSFILGILLFLVFGILRSQERAVDVGTKTSEAETRARVALEALKEELFYAKLDYSGANAARSKFLKFEVSNKTGAFDYGYFDQSNPPVFQPNYTCEVDFIPEHVYLEPNGVNPLGAVPATRFTINLNRNAAMTDALVAGKLVKIVRNGATEVYRVTLCSDVILNAANMNTGDIDGDGAADPVFELQNATGAVVSDPPSPAMVKVIKISVFVGIFDLDHTRFFLRNNNQQVKFKNSQN